MSRWYASSMQAAGACIAPKWPEMERFTKLAGYALNACAFALGAWIAGSALEPAEANTAAVPSAEGVEASPTPTTVDYGPHVARH